MGNILLNCVICYEPALRVFQIGFTGLTGFCFRLVLCTDHGYPVQGHMFFLSKQGQMDSCGFINPFNLIFIQCADEFH